MSVSPFLRAVSLRQHVPRKPVNEPGGGGQGGKRGANAQGGGDAKRGRLIEVPKVAVGTGEQKFRV